MKKQDVILLPGLLCDRGLFRYQLESMSRLANFQVADFSNDDSLEAMAAKVLEQAPKTFSLAGLSMGGYVAFEIMRKAPERVTRLALLDTGPYADSEEQRAFRNSLIEVSEEQSLGPVIEVLLPKLIHTRRLEDQDLVKAIDAMAFRLGEKAFKRQQTAIMNRKDSFSDLHKITCPTLVCVGRQDQLTPPTMAREMAKEIPRSCLVEIENCAHLSPLEQPEAISAVLSYWLQTT